MFSKPRARNAENHRGAEQGVKVAASVDAASSAAYGRFVPPSFELRITFLRMNLRLDNVQERLEAALARIDNAMMRRKSDDGTADKLKKLTDEHLALRGRHQELSNRLDATISRLRRVLKD